MRLSYEDIPRLGNVMSVYAHPDDECFTSGGIMAAAAELGQLVVCVAATNGGSGKIASASGASTEHLSQTREREYGDALSILGITKYELLGYDDGGLKHLGADEARRKAAVGELKRLMRYYRPDTIFTFEPEGITGHDDHKTVSAWTVAAASLAAPYVPVFGAVELRERYDTVGKRLHDTINLYFNTDQPELVGIDEVDILFELPERILRKKIDALRAHESQMADIFANPETATQLEELVKIEAFIRLR